MNWRHRGSLIRRLIPVVGVLCIVAGVLCLMRAWELKTWDQEEAAEVATVEDEGRHLWYNNQWYVPRENIRTFLLIGVDKFAGEPEEGYLNNQQSDFLVLLVVDRDADTVTALHVNRDTMANIPILGVDGRYAGASYGQIALAHTYGSGGKDSCRNTVNAVSSLLYDVEIDQYASITMDAVEILNDDIGGVPVTIEDDFTGTSLGWEIGQEVTLKGSEALQFVRARSELEDSTNLRRMERQQAYSSSFFEVLQSAMENDETLPSKIISDISEYLVTDCTTSQLEKYFSYVTEDTFLGFESIPGSAVKGETYMEYYPDEDGLKALLVQLFYEPKQA